MPAGAYALVDGRWKPLPENNGRIYQSTPQSLSEKLVAFEQWQDKQAGKASSPSKDAIADLLFDGRDPVPLAPSNDVVIVYLGRVTPPSLKDQETYPQLVNAPPIELSPLKTQRNGSRYAGLYLIAPRFYGFGEKGVTVTIEQPAKDITLLRSPKPLPAGRYALFCGAHSYELMVVE